MSDALRRFCADCHDILRADPGRSGRERVRDRLEALLADRAFVDAHCGPDAQQGVHVLYDDPALGFQVLAHINDKARRSPPHDHGESWAIYGQATEFTDMIEWDRTDDGSDPSHAELRPARRYRLEPGKAGIYDDGKIHSIDYPDRSRFVRVTGADLDRIPRIKIDPDSGRIDRMDPQQAT